MINLGRIVSSASRTTVRLALSAPAEYLACSCEMGSYITTKTTAVMAEKVATMGEEDDPMSKKGWLSWLLSAGGGKFGVLVEM